MPTVILPRPSMKTFNRYTGLCSNASKELSRKMRDALANPGCLPAAILQWYGSPEWHICHPSVDLSHTLVPLKWYYQLCPDNWLDPHMPFVLWVPLISTDDNGSRHLYLNVIILKLISVQSSKEFLNILMTPESMV